MRLLVLGAGGMAGHVIALYLRESGFEVDTLSASHPLDKNTHLIDVTDRGAVTRFFDSCQYDVVINCIAVLVKQSEDQKDLAAYLNSYWPHFLENYYRDSKTRIIHLSTDGVFSGEKSPYKETAPYDGQGFYDRSKALGEIINGKDLTLRMSIVGPDMNKNGVGLFNWFLNQHGDIAGYSQVFWNGVTTIELAKGITAAIEQKLTGVCHFAPKTSISKFDLLTLISDVFGRKDIAIRPNSSVKFNRELESTRTDFDFVISDYRVMVEEAKQWVDAHKHFYGHYL